MFIHVNDPSLKQKPWEISITTHLGQHPSGHTSATTQTIQPHPHPLTRSTPHPNSQNSQPLLPTKGGGTHTFLG